MKKHIYLALFMTIAFMSCQDDDDFNANLLSLDGENVTSPFLPFGEYEAASHFNANVVSRYTGKELIGIEYNIYEQPSFAEVLVYESTGASTPGNLLFSQVVTNQINPFSWNVLNLGVPIALDGGLWIAVYFETDAAQSQVIGCDNGPSRGNGDWLWDSADGRWLSYSSRTQESINWNIRGVLRDR